ncbi:hypothetical protein BV22DRAFT_1007725, partial [Leucogyrophana mollusca]
QDPVWKSREQGEEAQYIHEKEKVQLAALRDKRDSHSSDSATTTATSNDRDFEGGYGGQEDLEDRYATTSGEH